LTYLPYFGAAFIVTRISPAWSLPAISVNDTLTVSPLAMSSVADTFPPAFCAAVPAPLPTTFVFGSMTKVCVKVAPAPLEPLIVMDVGVIADTFPVELFDSVVVEPLVLELDPTDDTLRIADACILPAAS
jgi:hypothetical protein